MENNVPYAYPSLLIMNKKDSYEDISTQFSRISDNKFLLTGENVRLVFTNDQIVDFGDYVEFEYTDGNVVSLDQVEILWNNPAKRYFVYDLLVSEDGVNWVTIKENEQFV